MRPVAIVVCVALVSLNAEAAMLHVHTGGANSDHQHHHPAAHAHEIHLEMSPAGSEVEASDDDGSVVPLVLAKATASHTSHLLAVSLTVAGVETAASSHVPQFIVTSRAHGPPHGRPASPRAPPRSRLR